MTLYPTVKRASDVGLGLLLLALSSPIWVAMSIAIVVSSGLPVLYRARRMGRNAEPFTMFKFRSMRVVPAGSASGVTGAGDARVTPVGRLLRRWKLDEIPQLINVVTGDMSLVGPRPEDSRYLSEYTDDQRDVLTVRPGITGVTQLVFRHEERLLTGPDIDAQYRHDLLPKKLDLDLWYVRNRSIALDARLLVQTVLSVLGLTKYEDKEGVRGEHSRVRRGA